MGRAGRGALGVGVHAVQSGGRTAAVGTAPTKGPGLRVLRRPLSGYCVVLTPELSQFPASGMHGDHFDGMFNATIGSITGDDDW